MLVNATVSWCSSEGEPRGAATPVESGGGRREEICHVDRMLRLGASTRDASGKFYGPDHQEVALRRTSRPAQTQGPPFRC